jgi:hypothetical protein
MENLIVGQQQHFKLSDLEDAARNLLELIESEV